MFLRSIFPFLIAAWPALAADVALVDDELGQAVLFKNRGLCYAVLPNHVSAGKDRIALAVAEPAQNGTAEIFWRAPEEDLALAFVEDPLSGRCQIEFPALNLDLSAMLQTEETGLIKSVHFGGTFFDRLGASVVDVDETFVTVQINDSGIDAEVMQGLSGALLTISGRPAGIAIDAGSASDARFLRMDRLARMIGRNLSDDHPAHRAMPSAETGHGFRVTGFGAGDAGGVVALEPDDLAEPWVVQWTGAPLSFEVTLSNDSLVQLNRVFMRTQLAEATTVPRQIEVSVDRGLPGAPYWTSLSAPDMAPNGIFQMTTGGTLGRRIRITLKDVWDKGRPVRLDQLVID